MKLYSDEWKAEFEKHYSFPVTLVFYLVIDQEDKTDILFREVKTKAQCVGNIQWSSLKASVFNKKAMAVLDVRSFKSMDQYIEYHKETHEQWNSIAQKN
ncbi:hypothetical protein [Geomicrobium sp. JCM 19038]|uniref:hypothetical protein n=1 Tax=Geomicrobium sp. JCM 19038 TaxID=1460635 RepID=UPI0005A73288|nr:hypothetical protein [Geomicrobium sp. JCM 19038]